MGGGARGGSPPASSKPNRRGGLGLRPVHWRAGTLGNFDIIKLKLSNFQYTCELTHDMSLLSRKKVAFYSTLRSTRFLHPPARFIPSAGSVLVVRSLRPVLSPASTQMRA